MARVAGDTNRVDAKYSPGTLKRYFFLVWYEHVTLWISISISIQMSLKLSQMPVFGLCMNLL